MQKDRLPPKVLESTTLIASNNYMWAEYIRMEGTEFLIEKTSTSMIASIISNLTSSSGIDINDKINSRIRIKIIILTKSETESMQINKNNNGVELIPPENKNEDPFHLCD